MNFLIDFSCFPHTPRYVCKYYNEALSGIINSLYQADFHFDSIFSHIMLVPHNGQIKISWPFLNREMLPRLSDEDKTCTKRSMYISLRTHAHSNNYTYKQVRSLRSLHLLGVVMRFAVVRWFTKKKHEYGCVEIHVVVNAQR